MTPVTIFQPVCVLALWTLLVLLLVPIKRFQAASQNRVSAEDFKLGESERVPEDVRLPNRNLMNLLEIPVLFYVLCLSLYVTGHVDGLALELAWVYVGFRVLHSLVHLTVNQIIARLAMYAISNLVLVVLWSRFLLTVLGS